MSEIGKEYGAALFMLACEQDTLTDCAAGLDTVKSAFTSQPDYSELLASPSIPLSERLASLSAAFAERLAPVQEEYRRLLADKAYLESVMKNGADEAAYYARKTLSKVRRKLGFVNL